MQILRMNTSIWQYHHMLKPGSTSSVPSVKCRDASASVNAIYIIYVCNNLYHAIETCPIVAA